MRFKISAGVAKVAVLLVGIAALSLGQGNADWFDTKKPVTLRGTVSKVQWTNPNTWIYLAVKTADGATEDWTIEASSPFILLHRGLTKESLKIGTEIVVEAYPAENGSLRAKGRDLTLPDGKAISIFAARRRDGKDLVPRIIGSEK